VAGASTHFPTRSFAQSLGQKNREGKIKMQVDNWFYLQKW